MSECTCPFCRKPTRAEQVAEIARLRSEVDSLGPEFHPDGVVRWVLGKRIEQEIERLDSMREDSVK